MAFSGALKITDLDDFLTPSQACIIPVRNAKPSREEEGPTEIHIDSNNNYYEVSTFSTALAGPSTAAAPAKKALEKAEINLNDCLACSGCITSTESLLITLQSHNEVLDFIRNLGVTAEGSAGPTESRRPVLSISPQTLASLSAAYSTQTGRAPIPLLSLLRRIRHFLSRPKRGGWIVWDTTFARHLSLRETVVEFEERRSKDKGKEVVGDDGAPPAGDLPVLASACPGWVCYAEKAQAEMLPLMSSVRSSQAIMGGIVKTWWGSQQGLRPDEIYHVTAMPCYDKKLEASRSDFYSSVSSTRETDCVLTTGELDLLLQDLAFDPWAPIPGEADESVAASASSSSLGECPFPELLLHQGSSSGSYLYSIIQHIGATHPNPTVLTKREIRGSSDNTEYTLFDSVTDQVLFKGLKCYGFRNLQNLVRKIQKETGIGGKTGRGGGGAAGSGASKLSLAVAARRRKARTGAGEVMTPTTDGGGSDAEGALSGGLDRMQKAEDKKVDFVEVMACPGGCVNGGGQMKPVTAIADYAAAKVAETDEEGYQRPLQVEGIETPSAAANGAEESMRWSTKEWVAKVENIYWAGLPTPPPSPPSSSPTSLSSSAAVQSTTAISGELGGGDTLQAFADNKNARFRATEQRAQDLVTQVAKGDAAVQWEFLRTRFRKVEGDVLSSGGGLTHEAVKW